MCVWVQARSEHLEEGVLMLSNGRAGYVNGNAVARRRCSETQQQAKALMSDRTDPHDSCPSPPQ